MQPLLRSAVLLFLAAALLRADEGMWTFDNVPVKKMQAKYGFAPDALWLKNLQLATLRFPGGTGAFVSPEGLVITNHHVGRGAIAQVSSAQADYIKNGFTAARRDQEIKVPGLELMMLVSQENVTVQVHAAVQPAMAEKDALKARQNALSQLRKSEEAKTGLTCEPVTLYQGGEYWLYRYRKFTDVRLVAAPEVQIASFGGDPDNYTYPRWNLDFTLFRAYENGQPYKPEALLPFTATPLKAGDLTVISGHPGTTFRQQTLAQIIYARDLGIPFRLKSLDYQKRALQAFAATSEEAHRIAADPIYGIENGFKRLSGQLLGLQKSENLRKVMEAEMALQAAVAQDVHLQARVGQSWSAITGAVKRQEALRKESSLIDARGSALLSQALTLVRMFEEEAKPSEKRLTEFSEGSLKATRARLLNPRPTEKPLDSARFAAGLREAQEELGAGHSFVKAMLNGRSPEAVAKAAIDGTKIHELAFRRQLLDGGKAVVEACKDPLIQLARTLDPFNRTIRRQVEEEVTGLINEHGGRIAEARFAIQGKESYPDATFTLRLSYGPVATYATGSGTRAQPFTTFLGLFDRHLGWGGNAAAAEDGAWSLPQRWLDRKEKLDLTVPFNFVYNCDTVGGNSGSPVVNAKGEFVGINFDSVFEGQGGYYVYDADTKRAVAVDARAILESLRRIMDAEHLVKELGGK
jgi:hypothetical protein